MGKVEGRVVGSAMVGRDGHRGWVNYLAVKPELQGQGLGATLMAAAETAHRELGCPKVDAQIRRGNEAVEFYSHISFSEDDVVSMGKRLEVDTSE